MAYTARKIDVWIAELEDRPGALASKLEPLGQAGADLTFAVARRQPDRPGTGIVFLGPLKGARQTRAAESAGFRRATELAAVHLEGPNQPGAAGKVVRLLADAGINLRGMSAITIGRKFALLLAFDSPADADRALARIRSASRKK